MRYRVWTNLSAFLIFFVQVHVLNESRGSTLEVVTSRMKLRGSSIRFILVSATVPNIQDLAHWIGHGLVKLEPAKVFEVCWHIPQHYHFALIVCTMRIVRRWVQALPPYQTRCWHPTSNRMERLPICESPWFEIVLHFTGILCWKTDPGVLFHKKRCFKSGLSVMEFPELICT